MPKKNPPALDRKKGLYLKKTKAKGRGVFCVNNIKAGEILEVTPALLLDEEETMMADKTLLRDYTFTIGRVPKRLGLKNPNNASAVVMGILAFCNHSSEPNAEIIWEERNNTVYYALKATRAIARDTEICTSYGDGWFMDRDADSA